jgi:hypothetical protein
MPSAADASYQYAAVFSVARLALVGIPAAAWAQCTGLDRDASHPKARWNVQCHHIDGVRIRPQNLVAEIGVQTRPVITAGRAGRPLGIPGNLSLIGSARSRRLVTEVNFNERASSSKAPGERIRLALHEPHNDTAANDEGGNDQKGD